MGRQKRRGAPQHSGRRLTAAALAVLMGAGCITVAPFRAQAEENSSTGYQIYPNPHVATYDGGSYIVQDQVNVVYEEGIDQYTRNRLEEVLKLKEDIQYTESNQVVEGKTNILVGIEDSKGYVDQYAQDHVSVETQDLFHKTDAYVLHNQNGVITVLGRDTDAAFYGLTTLYHVFTQMDSYTIQDFHMEDWADVASRGFIEGYYGNPWTTKDRANLMTWAGYYKLNSYFYAPKDDPKHNAKWREKYTEKELQELIEPLAQAGNASKCKFVFALHPFMHDPINAQNYEKSLADLKAKFEQTMEHGVRQIAVLADDAGVPGGNNQAGWNVYTKLMHDLTDWVSSKEMQEKYEGLKVVIPFCPNDYMGGGNSAQLKYLGQNMPNTVPLVVTGGKVWGEVSPNFTQSFKAGVGRGPYMWINWPCTDNSKKHLIMGGYEDFLQLNVKPENLEGIVLNPMQQSEPSKVAIFGNACYAWHIWDSKEQANAAWDASFACVDHNSVVPTDASNALRELSKHMINQAMDGRVRALQESVELKDLLNSFKGKLNDGTVQAQDVNQVMAEFVKLQEAAKTYRATTGDQNLKEQIKYWLDCWDDTTAAAISYLNGVKAVLDKDSSNILKFSAQGKVALDNSKNHPFWYLNHNEYAEVGVQHIVPFIHAVADYVSQYAQTTMDPSKVLQTFITNRQDTPKGNLSAVFDGKDDTFISYQTPAAVKKGDYVGVSFNKPMAVENLRFRLGAGKNHFDHARLEYTADGTKWEEIQLRGDGNNEFVGQENKAQVVSVTKDQLPENFTAQGIRLVATQDNAKDCWVDVHEITINQKAVEPDATMGTYSTDQIRRNETAWDALKDKNNGNATGSEVWVSDKNNAMPVGAYIQYDLPAGLEPMKLATVYLSQGGSNGGDVINKGELQYKDAQGQWVTVEGVTVNNKKTQKFDLSGKDIVTTALRIVNKEQKKIWWRVGEFRVEFVSLRSDDPLNYQVIKSEKWEVAGKNKEGSMFDGKDNTYVHFDPDGSKNLNKPQGKQDYALKDDFVGYTFDRVALLDKVYLVMGNGTDKDKFKKYAIETSLDGKTWTAITDAHGKTYDSYEGKEQGTDVLNLKLQAPVAAKHIRIRNLEDRYAWIKISEFTVKEVVNGNEKNLYTNVQSEDVRSNTKPGMVYLTPGKVMLQKEEYTGVDLGNIKEVTSIQTSDLPQNLVVQTSMNGVTWTDYETNSQDALHARYVRVVNQGQEGVELNLTQFQVHHTYVAPKSVSSTFENRDAASDMRTVGNVNNVFDGKLDTFGIITGFQKTDQHITFDLGQVIHMDSLAYYIAEGQMNYPRHVKFEVSVDGEKDWKQVLEVGSADFTNTWDDSVAKSMEGKGLTHDSNNPGYMMQKAEKLDVEGRYIRVTPLGNYDHRWFAFNEIRINDGAYVSPETNRDIVSPAVEAPGNLPSYALDGDYATTYKSSATDSSFTYRVSEPEGLTSVRLVQLGAISSATVTAKYVGQKDTVELGRLNQAINEFKLDTGKKLESLTVSWTDTIPEIAEIVTSTQEVGQVDKAQLKEALAKTQPTETWTTDSVAAYEAAKAMAQAMDKNDNVTQTMVDAALGSLTGAVRNAVPKATDVDKLQGLVDGKVTNDHNVYTTFSYMAYSSALENLKAALTDAGNLSQAKATQLKTAVEEARAALVYSTRNRELAQLAILGYEKLVAEHYTADSYAAVTAAKQAVEQLVAQDKGDQRVDPMKFLEAKQAYEKAVAALVPAGQTETANKAVLNATIEYAQKQDTSNLVPDALEKFNAALEKAIAVRDNSKATQREVDDAWSDLADAIHALGFVKGDKTMLRLAIRQADGMVENQGKYVTTHWKELVDALEGAKQVAADESAMQREVDKATDGLLNAILAQRFRADKSILEELLHKTESVDLSAYNEVSVGAFRAALTAAQALMADETLTEDHQDQVDSAVMNLLTAMENLTAEGQEMPTQQPTQTAAPTATTQPVKGQVPQTGDNLNLAAYLATALVSAAGLAVLALFRKKRA